MVRSALTSDKLRAIIASWVQQARGSGDTDVYPGKREKLRCTWAVPFEVMVVGSGGSQRTFYATGRDISEQGLGMFTREQLERGSVVRIRLAEEGQKGPWVPARVAHCTQTVGGYRTGLTFLSDEEP